MKLYVHLFTAAACGRPHLQASSGLLWASQGGARHRQNRRYTDLLNLSMNCPSVNLKIILVPAWMTRSDTKASLKYLCSRRNEKISSGPTPGMHSPNTSQKVEQCFSMLSPASTGTFPENVKNNWIQRTPRTHTRRRARGPAMLLVVPKTHKTALFPSQTIAH